MFKLSSFRELLTRSIDEIKTNGFRSFMNSAIRFLHYNIYLSQRDKLPPNLSKEQVKNGIRVRNEDARLFDTVIGFPFYENNEIKYIQKYVESGDTVIDIGGGLGVTTVWCGRKAGKNGEVHVYEPSLRSIELIETTLDMNPVDATVNVNHAVVGEIRGQVRFDEGDQAETVEVEDLPECDIINMDCEGAELSILQNMTIRPRAVLVETHAQYGASGKKIIEVLERKGYYIVETRGDIDGLAQIAAVQTNPGI